MQPLTKILKPNKPAFEQEKTPHPPQVHLVKGNNWFIYTQSQISRGSPQGITLFLIKLEALISWHSSAPWGRMVIVACTIKCPGFSLLVSIE
jgi:hypothetical protein